MNRLSFAKIHEENSVADTEHFTICPQFFLANLTPEQYRAQQELYRRAFEKAQREHGSSQAGDVISFDI